MSSGGFKQELFAQFARTGQALSNGHRLELLEFLAQSERNVESLSRVAGLTVANTSRHLQQLKQAGLVSTRKDGIHVYYRLSGEDVLVLLNALRAVSETHLAEVDRLVATYLTVKDDLEPIPRKELLVRAREGSITVLDVRPPEEFSAGHLPGAVNVPVADLEKRLSELDPEQEIVAYCRGPYCVLAFEAVARLRKKGLKARRLEEGFPEWKSAGLPVEKG
ncbi:MAG: metalloregulator ArsR/SmtB family transcription factor [Acidiferrobacterales bacterium]